VKVITLPNGRNITIEGANYRSVGQSFIVTQANGSEIVYNATSDTAAATMVTDTDTFVGNAALYIAVLTDAGVTTWVSVTPNFAAQDASIDFIISGTLFLGSNVNSMKGDNGNPGEETFYTPTILDDSTMSLAGWAVAFQYTGVYTIYFSTDSGVTYTTTGLTITVT